jgi:hypothetical protein
MEKEKESQKKKTYNETPTTRIPFRHIPLREGVDQRFLMVRFRGTGMACSAITTNT